MNGEAKHAPLFALNLIRKSGDGSAYAAYAAHFKHLPKMYGMQPFDITSASTSPNVTMLAGSEGATRPLADCHDLVAVMYFPSGAAFMKAWCDKEVVDKAFPMRAQLVADGFEHIWIACSRVESAM